MGTPVEIEFAVDLNKDEYDRASFLFITDKAIDRGDRGL